MADVLPRHKVRKRERTMDQQAFRELFTRDQEVTRPPIVDLLLAASVVKSSLRSCGRRRLIPLMCPTPTRVRSTERLVALA